MADDFDPYHRWLGIPPKHQPPDHYRLLGLERFEEDTEVIRDAAERQMTHVRSYALGPRLALSQKILNELAGAKACLLTPQRKLEYDRNLQAMLLAPPEPISEVETLKPLAGSVTERGDGVTIPPPLAPPPTPPPIPSLAVRTPARHHDLLGGVAALAPVRQIDRLLAFLAGEGNTALHGFFRFVAVAVAVAVMATVLLFGVAMKWGSSASGRRGNSIADGTGVSPPPTAMITPTGEDAVAKEISVDLGGVPLEMVLIPAGSFTMGDDNGNSDEKPAHRVNITRPFYLGKHEVTQQQWEAVMGSNPSQFKGPRNPVENVSWSDCQVFLDIINANMGGQGGKFVLPTEAQWEYACRAGSTTQYGFGDDGGQLGDYAWYSANSGNETHPVGEKRPNAFGVYDMHGNVWEWCADWCDPAYYAESPADDPTGPSRGSERVYRGGSWGYGAAYCRTAYRGTGAPTNRSLDHGFRVARVPPE